MHLYFYRKLGRIVVERRALETVPYDENARPNIPQNINPEMDKKIRQARVLQRFVAPDVEDADGRAGEWVKEHFVRHPDANVIWHMKGLEIGERHHVCAWLEDEIHFAKIRREKGQ